MGTGTGGRGTTTLAGPMAGGIGGKVTKEERTWRDGVKVWEGDLNEVGHVGDKSGREEE